MRERGIASPVESRSGARENIIAGPYTPYLILCLVIETPKASRGRKRGERCPLTIRLGVRGSIVSSPSEVRPKMDFMHIFLGQKEATWNTIFSIFERRRGPQTSRGPGKLPRFPPLDGPGYCMACRSSACTVCPSVTLRYCG